MGGGATTRPGRALASEEAPERAGRKGFGM